MSLFKRKRKTPRTAATVFATELAAVTDDWNGNITLAADGSAIRLNLTISATTLARVVENTTEAL